MNRQFALFQRVGVFYYEDCKTGQQTSRRTRDKAQAFALLRAKSESVRQLVLNFQITRVYLAALVSFCGSGWPIGRT